MRDDAVLRRALPLGQGLGRIYKVVQQHNLGDVANLNPDLCTETSQSQQ